MNAFYVQKAGKVYPIFGVASIEEAKQFVPQSEWGTIVETDEAVYMNTQTGSLGFASEWDDLTEVVEVKFDAQTESWVES